MAQLSLSLVFNINIVFQLRLFAIDCMKNVCLLWLFIRISLEANLFLQSPDFSVELN